MRKAFCKYPATRGVFSIYHKKLVIIVTLGYNGSMSENKQPQPFEGFRLKITPADIAKGIGNAAVELFKLHLLSPVSDHKFVHPLDDTFDRPAYKESLPDLEGRDIGINQMYDSSVEPE